LVELHQIHDFSTCRFVAFRKHDNERRFHLGTHVEKEVVVLRGAHLGIDQANDTEELR
jgi:hypothetical protein